MDEGSLHMSFRALILWLFWLHALMIPSKIERSLIILSFHDHTIIIGMSIRGDGYLMLQSIGRWNNLI